MYAYIVMRAWCQLICTEKDAIVCKCMHVVRTAGSESLCTEKDATVCTYMYVCSDDSMGVNRSIRKRMRSYNYVL